MIRVVWVGRGMNGQRRHRGVLGSEAALRDSTVVGTCHPLCVVQTPQNVLRDK
jgi:hypothetical protein